MNIIREVPSVNFHLWEPCNMKCGFCFATFQDVKQDILPKGHLNRDDCVAVVERLAEAGFQKINFAGGEPTLCRWLPDLVETAKSKGMTTAIVTNGSKLTSGYLDSMQGSLDWITLSIDTTDPEKLKRLGRATPQGPMSEDDYRQITDMVVQRGIRLKINTVVNTLNWEEDFTGFIAGARPERWKLLQVLPVKGQSDQSVDQFITTKEQFDAYVERNRKVAEMGITVVPESTELITGSYIMVDPAGRFFDNVTGAHNYSKPILETGVAAALQEVKLIPERFRERGGLYDW